ncbi:MULTISPECIES: DUF421 domain-containing protein [Oceanobacillus]|uniref:DUF421 domain-containing protein n=2 Tax=Oceanobacillus TaxID=182709 RepID=A0A0A1MGD9_9BACI|nr:DUF421 domain-containing protein [Oceanobacillus oncorhynchi]MDM8100894.1 DUF421 domain-containing protein [Oceanobacillus oncorhynchi]UUI38770.1 DUF421 domain-containing protein [Oceanobacillus oncorhynchi]CEI84475.1 hypothetical protein BN997_04424 [Oceanobacillus oncorhynchi]
MPEWISIIIRSIILITVLFFFVKWLGAKQLSQLNIFETISGIVLGGIAAFHTVDPYNSFYYALLAMFVWFIAAFTIEKLSLKSKRMRDFTDGKSTVFIQNGKIMEENLKKEGYSTDDLLEKLRNNNQFLVSDVEFAVLEPTGELNVLPKKENQPITLKDLNITPAPAKEPQTVIADGNILLEPLANASLNPTWLEAELEKQNVTIDNVFLGQVDHQGQLFLDLYDDHITVPEPAQSALLLASMKKCQADLELFALATDNPASKEVYDRNQKRMQEAVNRMEPYLKS